MQVKVPKFLDVEDRVIAGLTWKQFVVLTAGIVAAVVANALFASAIAIPLGLLMVGLAVALSFVRINQRSFSIFLFSLWRYNFNPRRFFWQKERPRAPVAPAKEKVATPQLKRTETRTKLHEVALALDVQRRIRRPTP
ncbi:MAG: PrgI family protein [Candidatus Terrybacteria bacterium]|nr:PrgI family protein [Candidatus Terrybacteria bacterium]